MPNERQRCLLALLSSEAVKNGTGSEPIDPFSETFELLRGACRNFFTASLVCLTSGSSPCPYPQFSRPDDNMNPNYPAGKLAGFEEWDTGKKGRSWCPVCSLKPNIPPGKPVGLWQSAVIGQHPEIPLARPAVSPACHYCAIPNMRRIPLACPADRSDFGSGSSAEPRSYLFSGGDRLCSLPCYR